MIKVYQIIHAGKSTLWQAESIVEAMAQARQAFVERYMCEFDCLAAHEDFSDGLESITEIGELENP